MIEVIDEWFEANTTRKLYPNLANTTLDYSCEKDSITLSKDEILSVLVNGTFLDIRDSIPTQYSPPDMSYGEATNMFNLQILEYTINTFFEASDLTELPVSISQIF